MDVVTPLQGYKLADAEAQLLLPCLVEKAGHGQVSASCRFCDLCATLFIHARRPQPPAFILSYGCLVAAQLLSDIVYHIKTSLAAALQERIRAQHRELLKACCGVFESQRVCEFLVLGLQSKNNRTRTEAIEVRSGIDMAPNPWAVLCALAISSTHRRRRVDVHGHADWPWLLIGHAWAIHDVLL